MTELDDLRARLARAEEELEAWRATGPGDAERLQLQALVLRRAFPCLPGHASALLMAALAASSRPISYTMIDDIVPPTQSADRKSQSFLSTIVCYVRRALGPGAIITHRGYGYEMTPAARQRVAAILASG
jgi:hypothetical protein